LLRKIPKAKVCDATKAHTYSRPGHKRKLLSTPQKKIKAKKPKWASAYSLPENIFLFNMMQQ
jgi:hypothetical protein